MIFTAIPVIFTAVTPIFHTVRQLRVVLQEFPVAFGIGFLEFLELLAPRLHEFAELLGILTFQFLEFRVAFPLHLLAKRLVLLRVLLLKLLELLLYIGFPSFHELPELFRVLLFKLLELFEFRLPTHRRILSERIRSARARQKRQRYNTDQEIPHQVLHFSSSSNCLVLFSTD